ncbi:MAG: N-acetyltransferase [Muribaculaceae bacterium]|nr:N-acetyltransferase [Muribaculaceae bacterium]
MNDYIIRLATEADASQIAEIYNPYIATTVSFEETPVSDVEMACRIKEFGSIYPYFVAERDGKVIGYCYAHPWKERKSFSPTAETSVYVRQGEESAGVGRVLMEHLIEGCRQNGCHVLIACITAENVGSIRFHERLGFKVVSHFEEVGFKFNRWLDVCDMQLTL